MLLASIAARPAAADQTNRNLLPVGEREAFMANTGLTSASVGAVFYNPANLARLGHATVSLSGTTLLLFDVQSDVFIVIDGEDQAFEVSGFLPIPSSLVSTYLIGPWTVATSVLVPDVIELSNRQTYETPASRTTILQKNKTDDLWLGASAARRIGSRVSLGLSVFGIKRTKAELLFFQFNRPEEVTQLIVDVNTSVVGISALAGVHVQVTPEIDVGARVQSPMFTILDSGTYYTTTLVAGAMPGFLETDVELDEVRNPLPIDLGLGVSVRPVKGVEIAADVNVQLGQEYVEYEAPGLSNEVTLEPALRASLGAEIAIGSAGAVRGGVQYNGSATGELLAEGDVREDYVGVTAGFTWRGDRTTTGLGAFFLRSFGEVIPVGAVDRTEPVQSSIFGALYTVAYSL
jgi:hypothetical protein